MIYLALALVTIAGYARICGNQFIGYDDPRYVTDNPHVNQGISSRSFVWAFTEFYTGNWHPLTWISHMLDCEFFALNPTGHHFTNLLLHTVNTLLLLWVLHTATGRFFPAAFIAACFAVHPLHVESVAWIAERKDLLSAFFFLLCLAVYIRYACRPALLKYLFVVVLFAFALMSKPMAVTLPFVLLLMDYWPLNRSGIKTVIEKIPLFVMTVISCVITYIAQQKGGAIVQFEKIPLYHRIENALVSYVCYIGKIFCPSRLAILYPIRLSRIPAWQVAGAIVILAGITFSFVLLAKRKHSLRPLIVGWFWFLGMLVPVIGVIQVGRQSMADRYTYLPAIGFFIMAAFGISELFARRRIQKIILGLLSIVLILAMTFGTYIQAGYFKDSETIFSRALDVTENNYIIHYNLGTALLSQKQLDQAIPHFEEAIKIEPRFTEAIGNLGLVFLEQNRLEEAVNTFQRAISMNEAKPEPKLYSDLGYVLQLQGKHDQAVENYNKALSLDPAFIPAIFNMAGMLKLQGKLDGALSHYRRAMELSPGNAEVYNSIGIILSMKNQFEDASVYYSKALEIKPDIASAHKDLGKIYVIQKDFERAVISFTEALKYNPDLPDALNSLAWLLAVDKGSKTHDPQKALRLATRACELTEFLEAEIMDTLAVSYAALGKFSEAVDTAQKALQLARADKQKQLAERIQTRLKLYKNDQPYSEALRDKTSK